MHGDGFKIEIFTPEKADIYVAHPAGRVPWPVVRRLDQSRVRAVTDARHSEPDERRVRRIMSESSALLAVLPHAPSGDCTTEPALVGEVRLAAELGLPIAILMEDGVRAVVRESGDSLSLQFGDSAAIAVGRGQVYGPLSYSEQGGFAEGELHAFDRFLAATLKRNERPRPYAFFIGRLERDFTHAREAVRAAVEAEAGIPCLWSDDGRHRLDVESVSERTRLLIEHAALVIADLTLGVESPERENPSRAHEIGMSIAYGRKLMLCSQEPRRYPYFSIGDMQMTFWATEAELHSRLREWIRTAPDSPARTVLNHRLAEADGGPAPLIGEPAFTFDEGRRYVGPRTKAPADARSPIVALCAGAVCLASVHLATSYFGLGSGAYWLAYIALVFAIFLWPHLRGRAPGVLAGGRLATQVLLLTALTLMALALAATKAP